MKKIFLFTLSFLLIATCFAQKKSSLVSYSQKNKLTQLSKQYLRQAKKDKKIAFDLAKKNNWDTLTISKNGKVRSLQGLHPNGRPKYYTTFNNSDAAVTARTNSFYENGSLGLNLNGNSSFLDGRMGIWDSGMARASHQEFTNRLIIKDDASKLDQHATHVAGTMIAAGINTNARGMAWGAKELQAYDFNSDIAEMTAAADELIISNHSYGIDGGWIFNEKEDNGRWEWLGIVGQNIDANFGRYDEDAAKLDELCYNAPHYLPVLAAGNTRSVNGPEVGEPFYSFQESTGTVELIGNRPEGMSSNDGYDIIIGSTCSKNTLAVGAVRSVLTENSNPSNIIISDFSSWGPTDDGRIKPDLVGMGVDVNSSTEVSDNSYAALSGTSMASPSVCGSLLLLQEYYAKLNNNNFMQASTLKALAIHTTDEAGTNPGPDYVFGWGLLNMERAGKTIKNKGLNTFIIESNLLNDGSFTKSFVSSLTEPVKVSICWTDYKAELLPFGVLNNRKASLVNDLDIKLVESNTTYLPWKLDPNNPANAATKGDNLVDNVEQIHTGEQAVGNKTYTITVSHKGQLYNNNQNFSLIVTGVKDDTLPLEFANFIAQKQNNDVLLKWQTNSEKNTNRFEIQRSTDGINFTTINLKPTAGNSSSIKNYAYRDLTPFFGVNYYKIKTFDNDGTVYYSDIKSVLFDLSNNNEIAIYPNPAKDEINISWDKKNKPSIEVAIYSTFGKKIQSFKNISSENLKINVGNLPQGVYLLDVKDLKSTKSLGVKKIVKQ